MPHILLVVEENQGYGATLGDCSADPYICSLASEYASANNWYGVSHPSLPNYLALTSGSTQGCASDSCGVYSVDNLANQLNVEGIPWAGYMESMPSACYTGPSSGEYAGKHNPFVHYADVLGATCASHVLPYPGSSGLISALDGASAPDFVWITPNLIDDMHDGTVADGNSWLQTNLAPVLRSAWFTNFPSTVIITMDENDAQSAGGCCGDAVGGQVPEIIISKHAVGRGSVSAIGDHYGTLRTIEEAYGLTLLGAAANAVNGDLSSLFD
ncbi:MAG: alkaline phosphatase family protein [Candidatus Dormiibacterota bacterium]